MRREVKGVPWSVRISFGMPTRLNNRTSSRAITLEVAFCRGRTSGYCRPVKAVLDLFHCILCSKVAAEWVSVGQVHYIVHLGSRDDQEVGRLSSPLAVVEEESLFYPKVYNV